MRPHYAETMTLEQTLKAALIEARNEEGRGRQTGLSYGNDEGGVMRLDIGKGGVVLEFFTDGKHNGTATFPLETAWGLWFDLARMLADIERFGPEEVSD